MRRTAAAAITKLDTEEIMHNRKYKNLDGLLGSNHRAGAFFESLPSYVQEMIKQRSGNIQTEHELRMYAENIVQGDK